MRQIESKRKEGRVKDEEERNKYNIEHARDREGERVSK